MSAHLFDFFNLANVTGLSGISWLLPVSVFAAGFLASPHCMFMCGPLALQFSCSRKNTAAYHTGRVLAYSAAGAAAGQLGATALASTGFRVVVIAAFALLLISMGLNGLVGRSFGASFAGSIGGSIGRFLGRISGLISSPLRIYSRLGPAHSAQPIAAGAAGAMTIFLPCGHLYTFLTGAAATGSAVAGAVFMLAFAASTIPALGIGPLALRTLLARLPVPLHPYRAKFAGVMLVIAGLLSLFVFALQLHHPLGAPHCH